MMIPGIRGEWDLVDSRGGYHLMRSRENGVKVPMLIIDGDLNLVGEKDGINIQPRRRWPRRR